MHYTVAVVTKENDEDEVEKLLSPFDENIEVEPYVGKTKEQIIEENKKFQNKVKEDIEAFKNGTYNTKDYRVYWLDNETGDIDSYYAKLLDLKTDEEMYEFYQEYSDSDFDEKGNELSVYNPNSRWDWYEIGGRWDGFFKLKNGETANVAKISDVVWEGTPEDKAVAREFWEQYIEGKKPFPGEKPVKAYHKKEYYTSRYNSKEDFAERFTATHTYAVVTPEGVWKAPGAMGWFSSSEDGQSQAEYDYWFRQFVKEHQDFFVTFVDCHI